VAEIRKQASKSIEGIDSLPETYNSDLHGFYRWCYQQYTNVTYLKQKLIIEESQRVESSEQPASKCQRRSLSHSSQSALFPSDKETPTEQSTPLNKTPIFPETWIMFSRNHDSVITIAMEMHLCKAEGKRKIQSFHKLTMCISISVNKASLLC
jgi:hypothetical protein